MKTIKFVSYILHNYYSKGAKANIAYFSTICTMTFLCFLHLMQILILLDKFDFIQIEALVNYETNHIKILAIMIPIYLALTFLIKKTDIALLKENYDNNWDKVFKSSVWLIVYFILSITLLVFLATLKKQ
jgi:hypothetical protein